MGGYMGGYWDVVHCAVDRRNEKVDGRQVRGRSVELRRPRVMSRREGVDREETGMVDTWTETGDETKGVDRDETKWVDMDET